MNYTSTGNWTAESHLEHHGIKGQRWGVRRFQNYDGTYTQDGLRRYQKYEDQYSTAKKNLKETKRAYRSGSASQLDVNSAKNKVKDAKAKREKEYERLKKAHQADKGKELYRRGKTITGNDEKREALDTAISRSLSVASIAGGYYLTKGGIVGRAGDGSYIYNKAAEYAKVAAIGAASVAAGAAVTKAILNRQDKKMRAYRHYSKPNSKRN